MSIKYKRIPIEVEAMQVKIPFQPIVDWCGGSIYMEGPTYDAIIIDHFPNEGCEEVAEKGEWIIKFPEGNFIILSDELFKANYEPSNT